MGTRPGKRGQCLSCLFKGSETVLDNHSPFRCEVVVLLFSGFFFWPVASLLSERCCFCFPMRLQKWMVSLVMPICLTLAIKQMETPIFFKKNYI